MVEGTNRRSFLGQGFGLGTMLAVTGTARAATQANIIGRSSPRFKCTEFIRRRRGMSSAEFLKHWQETRERLMRKLAGLSALTFNVTNEKYSPHAPYDGAVELWFESEAAYDQAVNGDGQADLLMALDADSRNFMEPDFLGLFTREVFIKEEDKAHIPNAKRLGLVSRPPSLSRAQFQKLWLEDHAQPVRVGKDLVFRGKEGLQQYVLDFTIGARFSSATWDGYAVMWWPDWPTYEASIKKDSAQVKDKFSHNHLLITVNEHRSALA